MRRRSIMRLGVALAAASLVVTACGSRGDDGEGGSGSQGSDKVAKIGVIAPLSGELQRSGPWYQELCRPGHQAGERVQGASLVGRWSSPPRTTRPSPTSARTPPPSSPRDDEVVGVVGTLNSSVVAAACSRCSLRRTSLQVSPANTNPTLTKGADFATNPEAPVRQLLPHLHHRRRSRVRSPLATCLQRAQVTKVATIHDKKTYGQGLVGGFTDEFKKLGGDDRRRPRRSTRTTRTSAR